MSKLIRNIALWVFLSPALLLSATSAIAQCAYQSISYGQTVSGSLNATDCTDDVFGTLYFADYYKFTGTAGDKIAIQMSSTSFDTWLVLISPSGSMTENNDGGGGTNSRIPATSGYYTLPESGIYQLEATSNFSNTTGSYSLSLAKEAVSSAATLNLVSGWNLLGNSSSTALNVVSAFGDSSQVAAVWKWIAPTAKWAFYTPTQTDGGAAYAASKGFDALTSVAGGEGFWVNAKTAFSVASPTGTAIDSASFRNLPPGWSLLATADNKTPSEFNNALNLTTLAAGEIPNNFTSLWAWDAALDKWYLYAPSLDATGGLAAYIQGKGYLDFSTSNKRLGPGVGFWINQADTKSTTVNIGTAGGTVVADGLMMKFPQGAVSNPVNVVVTQTSADLTFNAGSTVLSGAYRIEIGADLQQPVTLSFAAKTAAGGTDMPLAAVVDGQFTDMYNATPHRGIKLLEVAVGADGYTVTLPASASSTANTALQSRSAVRRLAAAPASNNSFTIYIFAGYAMKSSAHFNIRYPARGCNSLVMNQWLQNAEEAYSRLVGTMKFDPFGLAMPATRMTMDVVDLGPTEWGALSFHTWTLGLFNNLVIQFELPTRVCNSPTQDQDREMEVTIGHEFFHGIQNTYDPAHALIKSIWGSRGLCLYDASSTWFEGEMLDTPSYLGEPARAEIFSGNAFYTKGLGYGCASDPRGYGYGGSTFLRYLTNKFGADLVLVLWRNILNGAGFGVPIDAMKSAKIDVASEWDAFSTKLVLGTTGMGWPIPVADSTLVYKTGAPPLSVVDSMYQLSTKKHKLDFTSLANSTSANPSCSINLKKGAGTYSVRLYHLTTLVADWVNKNFTPIASDKYSLVVTNWSDTQFVDAGIRYGRQDPVEVVIECAGEIQVDWSYSQYQFVDAQGTQRYCTTGTAGSPEYSAIPAGGQWSGTTFTYKDDTYSILVEFSNDYTVLKLFSYYQYYSGGTYAGQLMGWAEVVDVPLNRTLSTPGTSFFTLTGSEGIGHVPKFSATSGPADCKEIAFTGGPVPFFFGLQLRR